MLRPKAAVPILGMPQVYSMPRRGVFAELAVFSVPGFVDEALDVEVFPVVEVFEAENGVV
jgi:hypothetical protein